MHKVCVIVGSLRRESINKRFAHALEKIGGDRFAFTYADLAEVPVYNEDLWADPPPAVLAMKAAVTAADAVLLVTPEYNRSIPPAMKNAVDWGSRPYGQSCWKGKPTSIVGCTGGAIGTAVAQSHLRSVVPILEMVAMGQPEVYFTLKPGVIADDFTITDEKTAAFLETWAKAFDAWINRMKA